MEQIYLLAAILMKTVITITQIFRLKRRVNGRICRFSQALSCESHLKEKIIKGKLIEVGKIEPKQVAKLNGMFTELRSSKKS